MHDLHRVAGSSGPRVDVSPVNARGFTLIELLVGSAIAAMVGAFALAILWRTGLVAARSHAHVRADDEAWLALAVISRDLRAAREWHGCLDRDSCGSGKAHRVATAIIADQVQWFADDGLWRCERKDEPLGGSWACARFLGNISSVNFVADLRGRGGRTMREAYARRHGDRAESIDVTIWTNGGRPYSRTTGRGKRAD